jgi:hypothetical protein
MSVFDPAAFLSATVTESLDTSLPQVVPGEYQAVIDKIDFKSFDIKNGERAGQQLHKLIAVCKLVAPGQESDGRTVQKDCLLDITPNGTLDTGKGKNIDLGVLRAATNLNTPGQPFSPAMLVGRMVKVLVEQEADRNDPNKIYTRIRRIAAIG